MFYHEIVELGETKEGLRRIAVRVKRAVLGPGIIDRDYPDKRPPHPARDRLEVANRLGVITSSEEALRIMRQAIAADWSDYTFKAPIHKEVAKRAKRIAREMGATEEEILEAERRGAMGGATLRAGFDDYWR